MSESPVWRRRWEDEEDTPTFQWFVISLLGMFSLHWRVILPEPNQFQWGPEIVIKLACDDDMTNGYDKFRYCNKHSTNASTSSCDTDKQIIKFVKIIKTRAKNDWSFCQRDYLVLTTTCLQVFVSLNAASSNDASSFWSPNYVWPNLSQLISLFQFKFKQMRLKQQQQQHSRE